jgi:hypothetical protein
MRGHLAAAALIILAPLAAAALIYTHTSHCTCSDLYSHLSDQVSSSGGGCSGGAAMRDIACVDRNETEMRHGAVGSDIQSTDGNDTKH